jgi:hypothetical protein
VIIVFVLQLVDSIFRFVIKNERADEVILASLPWFAFIVYCFCRITCSKAERSKFSLSDITKFNLQKVERVLYLSRKTQFC